MDIAIIGDIHGCIEEFDSLLKEIDGVDTIVSLGDLTDKGPDSNAVVELAAKKQVILVDSNHDNKYIDYIRKNRNPDTIKSDSKRAVYKSLSDISKKYLLTAKPYFLGEYYHGNKEVARFIAVHGGIGPNNTLFPINNKTHHEILRLRYVDKDTLEKVSTIHNIDGTWGPEHTNVYKWQEVYHGQYGPVFHGHIVESMESPVYWLNGKSYPVEDGRTISLDYPSLIFSIDTGAVYGGKLTAAIVNTKTGNVIFKSIKANKAYDI